MSIPTRFERALDATIDKLGSYLRRYDRLDVRWAMRNLYTEWIMDDAENEIHFDLLIRQARLDDTALPPRAFASQALLSECSSEEEPHEQP